MRAGGRPWLVLALLAVPLAGCAGGDPGPSPYEVRVLDDTFDPDQMSVMEGETVTWRNEGERTHSVEIRAENGSQRLHSRVLDPGDSTSFTFEEADGYLVWCRFHGQPGAGMASTIDVYEGGTAPN